MTLFDLVSAGRKKTQKVISAIDDGILDVIVHPMWGTYFNYTYNGFRTDEPFLRGTIDGLLKSAITSRKKAGDFPFLVHSRHGVNRWLDDDSLVYTATDNLLSSWGELITAYERLSSAKAIDDLGTRPAIYILPGVSEGEKALNYRDNFVLFLESLDIKADSLYLTSFFERTGMVFDCGDKLTEQRRVSNAESSENVQALRTLLNGSDIEQLRTWGGYVNKCLSSGERSFDYVAAVPYKTYLSYSETSPWTLRSMLKFPLSQDSKRVLGDEGAQEVASIVNAMIYDSFDAADLEKAVGLHPFDQLEVLRRIPYLVRNIEELKKAYAFRHDQSEVKEQKRAA